LVLACAIGVCAVPRADDAARATEVGEARAVTEGRLRAQDGKKLVDVPLKHTDVAIDIAGYLADVRVTQTFQNPYEHKIDAVYLFPLPTNAAVNHMEIQVGARRIVGEIQRREDAVRTYRRARKRGHVAALLTQERPNLFTQHVANIEPGHEVVVTLRYVQSLAYDNGGYEVVFPMVAPPRYVPERSKAAAGAVQPKVLPPDTRSSHDIGLAVTIDAGVPIAGVESPSHRVHIERDPAAPSRASARIDAGDTIPNKDFILRYHVAGAKPAFAVLGHRNGDVGSFFLMAQPPERVTAEEITPRELIFAIDTSSSMAGLPLAKAKALVRKALSGMQPHDTFQIVRFDDAASALGPAMIANKKSNVGYALDWVDALAAGGATEMASGIDAALAFPHDPGRLRIVVFVTDGFIGNEDEILAKVGAEIGGARLFSFGVGSAVNRYLLEGMAAFGRGAVSVVRPDEDTSKAVGGFYRRIDKPLFTDIRIDWAGLEVGDVVPGAIPDLFAGQPLILSGHYARGGQAVITVRGRLAGRETAFRVPVDFPEKDASRPAVATVWARARIAELSRKQIRGETPETRQEIVDLALAHSLMTRYTAFVAVDASRVTEGAQSTEVTVPVEVPEGVMAYARKPAASYGTFGHGVGGAMATPHKDYYFDADPLGDLAGEGGGGGDDGDYLAPATEPPPVHNALKSAPLPEEDRARRVDAKRAAETRPALNAAKRKGLQRCVEKRRESKPDLAGSVHIRITVSAAGAVVKVSVSGAADGDLSDCIRATARTWSFGKRNEEASIDVVLRIE